MRSRSEIMPTTVLPSVRTTSVTTSAPMFSVTISFAAAATDSRRRILITRVPFVLRICSYPHRILPFEAAPSCALGSTEKTELQKAVPLFYGPDWYTKYQVSIGMMANLTIAPRRIGRLEVRIFSGRAIFHNKLGFTYLLVCCEARPIAAEREIRSTLSDLTLSLGQTRIVCECVHKAWRSVDFRQCT